MCGSRHREVVAGPVAALTHVAAVVPLELPPVGRTPEVWAQRSSSDGAWSFSNSIGLRMPRLEWRRFELYQHSIHSKTALASSSRVSHFRRSRTSSCRVPQNDSIIALS